MPTIFSDQAGPTALSPVCRHDDSYDARDQRARSILPNPLPGRPRRSLPLRLRRQLQFKVRRVLEPLGEPVYKGQ